MGAVPLGSILASFDPFPSMPALAGRCFSSGHSHPSRHSTPASSTAYALLPAVPSCTTPPPACFAPPSAIARRSIPSPPRSFHSFSRSRYTSAAAPVPAQSTSALCFSTPRVFGTFPSFHPTSFHSLCMPASPNITAETNPMARVKYRKTKFAYGGT
jgi:hypothetical protein